MLIGKIPLTATLPANPVGMPGSVYHLSKDPVVSAYNVKDFCTTGDGVTDVTSLVQTLIDSLGRLGGGTVFLPEGRYVFRGNLTIRKGITLRGEWSKPVKGQAIKGTILMVYAGRGSETATPFITMETSAAVRDLAFWYPEQSPIGITPYPPAIQFGEPGYFGNEFCNAKNITLVNAYSGVVFSRTTGGTCPVINGIYGTPLSRGVEIDNISDVGRIENIDFSPSYWSGSGLTNAPAAGSAFESWIYQNGTGVVMRRNDWSYLCYVNIEGYNRDEYVAPSIASPGAVPNGHQYSMTFTNCKTAIYIQVVSSNGIMFSQVTTVGCDSGFVVGPNTSGAVQFHTCTINADVNAVVVAVHDAAVYLYKRRSQCFGRDLYRDRLRFQQCRPTGFSGCKCPRHHNGKSFQNSSANPEQVAMDLCDRPDPPPAAEAAGFSFYGSYCASACTHGHVQCGCSPV